VNRRKIKANEGKNYSNYQNYHKNQARYLMVEKQENYF